MKDYIGYVYVNEIGELINPDYISSTFPKFLRKNGLRQIRFHDTRHSCASLLLRNGVQMKEIQAWLGHSGLWHHRQPVRAPGSAGFHAAFCFCAQRQAVWTGASVRRSKSRIK